MEELLRYESPLHVGLPMVVLEPLEIAGVSMAAGDLVLPGLLRGNRDAARTTDPDTLDIGRTDNPHLAFGTASTTAWAPRWPGWRGGSRWPG